MYLTNLYSCFLLSEMEIDYLPKAVIRAPVNYYTKADIRLEYNHFLNLFQNPCNEDSHYSLTAVSIVNSSRKIVR